MQYLRIKPPQRRSHKQFCEESFFVKFGLALTFLALMLNPFGCKPKTSVSEGEAEIRAQLQGKGQLKVDLKLPPHSHLYLDRGLRGNLIPVSFDWQPVLKKGLLKKAPELASAPQGEYDKDVEAKVLRSQGSFVFSLAQDGTVTQGLAGQTLRVRTQVCNEVEGICYRPKWTDVQILP